MSFMNIKAWHFAPADKRLRHGDERPIRRNVRMWALPKGRALNLCHHGMHGSVNIIDALEYAPGPVLSWCEFGGEILSGSDKLCAEWRRPLWIIDATPMLWEWARWCALQVAHLWDMPDIVREYMETGDESKRAAAGDAAWAAAWAAAGDAAWAAARAAARDAAWDAAWAAARDAARAAARDAAGAAAWAAARDAQRTRMLVLLHEAGAPQEDD